MAKIIRKSRFADLTEGKVNEEVSKLTKPKAAKVEKQPAGKKATASKEKNAAEEKVEEKKGRGRPKNTRKAFTSSLEPEIRTKLDLLAAAKGQSISDALHDILGYYFNNVEEVELPKIMKKYN